MKNQRTKTQLSIKTIIIMMIIMLSTTLSYAQWSIDEGFEGGIIPADWTIYDVNGDGHEWHALDYTSHAHSGDWMAAVDCYDSDGDDWLITPQVTIQPGDVFTFFAKAWYSTENMNVFLSTTGNAIGDFDETLGNYVNLDDNYVEYTYDLSAYAGQDIYLAIQWIQDTYGFVVDDVKVGQPDANDVGMVSIEIPGSFYLINSEIYPSGTIQNYGVSDITGNFDILCEIFNESNTSVYNETVVHTGTLASGATDVITFATAWTPADAGTYSFVMYTDLVGDAYSGNDTLTGETDIVLHYGTGGPDAMGYRWIDSDEAGGPVYDWIEISGTGTSAITYDVSGFYGDDNFSEPIPIGFDFPFYGINRTYFHADINGEFLLSSDNFWYEPYPNAGWDTDGFFFNYSYPVPGFSAVPALVAVLWDNLHADEGIGDIYFQTFGTEPDRYCVVEWHNLRFDAGTVEDTTLCFEAIFYENGDMVFQYQNLELGQTGSVCPHDFGQSSTVAIQADNTDIGLCYLRELVEGGQYLGMEPPGNMLTNELAIKFYQGEDLSAPIIVYEDSLWNTFNNTPELSVTITDMGAIESDTLYFNTGSSWQGITYSSFEEPNIYHYQFPVIPNSTTLNYYFVATDNSANQNRGTLPANAPEEYFTFKILPTDGVDILFATPGNKIGYEDYQNKEYPKYIAALDAADATYDIYNWAEYEEYDIPDSYRTIFIYSNSTGFGDEEDTLSLALMEFLDKGTNENPKNIFMASDGLANARHPLGTFNPQNKFFRAYLRAGWVVQVNPPIYGGTDGIGGPNITGYSNGSMIGMGGSPIGAVGVEIPVYSNTPDVIYNRTCPDSYTDVTNPDISSWGSYKFEDGPHSGNAYSKGNGCAVWLDNLIYKSFYMTFDISQFTSDDDINTMIQEALDWFGVNTFKSVNLDVFLEGPFNSTDTDMDTDLNSGGLIPLAQPFNTTPWNYTGTESVTSIPNANVVDWVLIEYRDAPNAGSATPGTMIARQAAFLLNDGSIVGLDGASDLQFSYTPNNQLFVVTWHRNHLSIMSANPLTESGGVYSYDYTTTAGQAYGTNAQKYLSSGIYGMIAGDADASGLIDQDDKTIYWEPLAGTNGYNSSDLNLDTEVDNKDKDDFWVPNLGLGSQVPD